MVPPPARMLMPRPLPALGGGVECPLPYCAHSGRSLRVTQRCLLLPLDRMHGHKAGLASLWPEDYKWRLSVNRDIFTTTHEVPGTMFERKEIVETQGIP